MSDSSEKISLSRYLPKGTSYFYSSPHGGSSEYLFDKPHHVFEILAARPLLCAGPDVSVVVYASNMKESIRRIYKDMNIPQVSQSQIIALKEDIGDSMSDDMRNELTKKAIKRSLPKGSLIMTQPHLDEGLREYYQIPQEVLFRVNAKVHMPEYMPASQLPCRYGEFTSSKEFAAAPLPPLPCVVKVSSSAGGDGVRICMNKDDFKRARKEFSKKHLTIIIEEFLQADKNLCVQFGIPADPKKDIEIIGFHEQIIAPDGEFLGGIVDPEQKCPGIENVYRALLADVLPKIRARGWYGIGGIDVLLTKDGRFYWIDPNLRLNATTCFLTQVLNGDISKRMATFIGLFRGTEQEFRDKILPLAKFGSPDQLINIAAISHDDKSWHMHGAFLFENKKDMPRVAQQVIALGIESRGLTQIAAIKPVNA